MIKTYLVQKIENNSLDGYPLTVRTNKENDQWITINHFETNIHLPVDTLPELIEVLQNQYKTIRNFKP